MLESISSSYFHRTDLRAPLITINLPFADKLAQGLGFQTSGTSRGADGSGEGSLSNSDEDDEDIAGADDEKAGFVASASTGAASSAETAGQYSSGTNEAICAASDTPMATSAEHWFLVYMNEYLILYTIYMW